MNDRRDFVALDWVAGEIAESLRLAVDALDAYVSDPADNTKLRFCLAYIHQVQGSLRMVEFFGAALLAEEMERCVNALLERRVPDAQIADAIASLRRAMKELPAYLDKVRESHRDFPSALVLTLNELRAVQNLPLMSMASLFSPAATPAPADEAPPPLGDSDFLDVSRKLRQMYQIALLGFLRGHEVRKNLNYLGKVCARVARLSAGAPVQELWHVNIALLEGLLNGSITSGVAVRTLLRRVDREIRLYVDRGKAILLQPAPADLIRDILFYVATSGANSQYIADIRKRYGLDSALATAGDADGAPSEPVRSRLTTELGAVAAALRENGFAAARQAAEDVVGAAAILGLNREYGQLRGALGRYSGAANTDAASLAEVFDQVAEQLRAPVEPSPPRIVFNDSEEAQAQLDRALGSVVRESRNGLELVREEVVNFVANHWQTDYLRELPDVLGAIAGGLAMAERRRAARILESCRGFIADQLLADPHVPDWQTLDALADALTSVDYFLERFAGDHDSGDGDVLDIAETCVAALGYPVTAPAGAATSAGADKPQTAEVIPWPSPAERAPAPEPAPAPGPAAVVAEGAAGEDADEIDPEVVEIFIEEAGEVLDAINEQLPIWEQNLQDKDCLGEVRRAFHTLKGSGRTVGATQIGETGWALEDMLNRVLDKSTSMDEQRLQLVKQTAAVLPAMIEAFAEGRHYDPTAVQQLADHASALAREQSPAMAAPAVVPVAGSEAALESEESAAAEPAPVAAAPLPEVAETGDDDTALLEIFAAEARIHLQVVDNYLTRAEAPAALSDALQRSLHTLKGAANMAGMTSIAAVVAPTEKLIKEMRAMQLRASVEVLAMLTEVARVTAAAIDSIEAGAGDGVADQQALVDRIAALTDSVLTGAAEPESEADVHRMPGDTARFLVAAGEHLAAIQEALAGDAAGISAAVLHYMSGHAGVVADRAEDLEIDAIAELAHHLRVLMQQATEPMPEAALQLGREAVEHLMQQLNQLAAEQQPEADDDLVDRLQGFDFHATGSASPAWGAGGVELEEIEFEAAADVEAEDDDAGEIIEISLPALEPEAVAAPAVEEIDPEILGIFLEEAGDLLEAVDEDIHRWAEEPNASHLEDLQRQLHTLKGGARMAGLTGLGDLCHRFESMVIAAQEGRERVDEQFQTRLLDYHEQLLQGVNRARRGQDVGTVAPASVPAPTAAPAAPAEPPAAVAAPGAAVPAADVDPEILAIFLEEAEDLLEGIDGAILRWSAEAGEEELDALQRHLHTLKGGARMAGLHGLGQLVHECESLVIAVQQGDRPGDAAFLTQLQGFQDRITNGLAVAERGEDYQAEPAADVPAPAAAQTEQAPSSPALPAVRAEAEPEGRDVGFTPMEAYAPQEMIKVSAQLMENLVNLAGETSIARSRAEEQVSDFAGALEEMETTVQRLQEQVRRLDIETEAQILFRQEQVESEGQEGFDPLEFDRYSQLQQLSRSLMESGSDIRDLRNTLIDKVRDMETLLLQQSRINTDLQEGLMRSRMVHFARMVPRLRRIVRQISLEVDKRVEFKVYNAEGELDRQVLERIVPPLEHMLRNAVDHGIEPEDARIAAGKNPVGTISMHFSREGGDVLITLSDDGRGIDFDAVRRKAEKLGHLQPGEEASHGRLTEFLFQAGFSTAEKVTQISGRGVGMDVVYSEIKQLGGSIEVESNRGVGTRFLIRLPFTVSVNRALMVSVGGDIFAIPFNSIEGIVRVSPYELEVYYQPEDAPPFEYAGQQYNLLYLGALLQTLETPHLEGQVEPRPVILARGGDQATAIQVDSLLGSREIVVKTLGPQFATVHGLSGATVLGDGSVVVILDLLALIRADSNRARELLRERQAALPRNENQLVMVVDDSVTVRKVTSRLLERQGMEVIVAKDGVEAITLLQETERLPDIILLDIEMPRMDGFEVASRVRHTARLQHIPIIMITSRTGEKHRERALSLGVNRYLGKPYQEMALLQAIAEVTAETVPTA